MIIANPIYDQQEAWRTIKALFEEKEKKYLKELAEKERALQEKEQALSEKDKLLNEKDKLIEELLKKLHDQK